MPALYEFAMRGAFLYLLRQYGDLAAIITVSVICALFEFDIRLIPAVIIASAVLSYFSLAAENVAVPIFMHIVINIVISVYTLMKKNGIATNLIYVYFTVCLAAGIGAAVYLLSRHSGEMETETAGDPLPTRDKFFCMITSIPVILAVTVMLVLNYL
jgi:membrane protease YdiL (CAAX protease family)